MRIEGEGYTLIQGDCREWLPTLAVGSVDSIICDLPYGTTACEWDSVIPLDELWPEFKRVIKPRGAVVLFGSQPFTSALVMSNLEWFKWADVWHKTRPTGFLNANVMPLRQHEDLLVFGNGRVTYNPQMDYKPVENRRQRAGERGIPKTKCYGRFNPQHIDDDNTAHPRSVTVFNNPNHGEAGLHPTQKPVDLLAYLIRTYTNPGETVLDCTMGSGSTGVAALREGRRFIGMELHPLPDRPISDSNPDYFAIAHRRIEDAARAAAGLPKQLNGTPADLEGLPLLAAMEDT